MATIGRASLAWFAAALLSAGAAVAQDYPNRQIVIIVPFPAGGSTDALARIIAEPCGSRSANR